MILLVLTLAVGFGLAIRPAIQHDNDQPVHHTGTPNERNAA
jgi:hypothetical protein